MRNHDYFDYFGMEKNLSIIFHKNDDDDDDFNKKRQKRKTRNKENFMNF